MPPEMQGTRPFWLVQPLMFDSSPYTSYYPMPVLYSGYVVSRYQGEIENLVERIRIHLYSNLCPPSIIESKYFL